MEIIENKALKLHLRHPARVTSVIPKSKIVGVKNDLHTVLVHWGHDECMVLKNLGIKSVPSPILKDYPWHGLYKPFAHQRDTAAFLTMNRRAYCFNEMGSGKTCSVLWAADYLMNKGAVNRVLIVCPLSIMSSAWRADAFKSVMHRRVDIAYGAKLRREEVIRGEAEIVIINFDGVEIVADAIEQSGFDLIVIDEFNAYKNAQTKRWKVMNRLLKPHISMWGLTGSPASQSPTDAYGLAKLMNPQSVPNFFGAFRDNVMHKITQYKYIPRPGASDYVFQILQPAIRFTKEECLDLPSRVYVTREVPMTTQQAKYYKLLKEEMLFQAAGEEVSAANAAVNLGKLLQIASGAVYSDAKEVVEFDCSSRLKVVEEIIEESSKKVIIFAVFKHNIQLLQDHLTKSGYTVDVIHGKVTPAKRTEVFDRFQTSPNPRVLVIQPRSASHGVTLTAANTIVWWNPTTSYETYIQANDRIHRAGQDAPCTVVHLTGSPVEERFYKALEHKGKMLDSIMDLYKEVLEN